MGNTKPKVNKWKSILILFKGKQIKLLRLNFYKSQEERMNMSTDWQKLHLREHNTADQQILSFVQ